MKAFCKESREPLAVADRYDEGLSLIGQEKYALALACLLKIEGSEQAPPDTLLYIVWARLKLLPLASSQLKKAQKREELSNIAGALDSCPISLRSAALFWYVKALLLSQKKQWGRARDMLEKSLRARPDFEPAREEWKRIQEKTKSSQAFIRPAMEWLKRAI